MKFKTGMLSPSDMFKIAISILIAKGVVTIQEVQEMIGIYNKQLMKDKEG